MADFYTFGGGTPFKDSKEIRDNQNNLLDGSRTNNGITVVAYYRSNVNRWDRNGKLKAVKPNIAVPNRNGEYRFDWMKTETTIDQKMVKTFLNYMDSIPDDAIVIMYSGYYHGIDQMPEAFYAAIERFGSKDVRNLKASSVWALIGSGCEKTAHREVKEAFTHNQEELIRLEGVVFDQCADVPPKSNSTSIEEVEIGVKVFPNPAVNELSVTVTPNQDVVVSIFGLTGKEYIKTTQTQKIDISSLPKGIFIVQVKTDGKIYSSRLTKR